MFWAERDAIDITSIKYKMYTCPNIEHVKESILIAPDGIYYACCLDSKNELNLGSVMVTSMDELITSQKREDFIKQLEKKEFEKL